MLPRISQGQCLPLHNMTVPWGTEKGWQQGRKSVQIPAGVNFCSLQITRNEASVLSCLGYPGPRRQSGSVKPELWRAQSLSDLACCKPAGGARMDQPPGH